MSYIPLGFVIALGSTSVWTPPASGVIKDGWAICDGTTYPAGSRISGTSPNLSDNRFLMGYTTCGAAAVGANSLTLSSNNIPQVNSGQINSLGVSTNHYHGVITGATSGEAVEHTHNITLPSQTDGHTHSASMSQSGPLEAHYHTWNTVTQDVNGGRNPGTTKILPAGGGQFNTTTSTIDTDHGHTFYDTSGDIDTNHTHGGSTNTFATGHVHSFSASSTTDSGTDHTHNTTISVGTASPTAIDNRPNYLNVVFLIKVQ